MILCLLENSDSNLKKIFSSILKKILNDCVFSEDAKKVSDGIVMTILDFNKTIIKYMPPLPENLIISSIWGTLAQSSKKSYSFQSTMWVNLNVYFPYMPTSFSVSSRIGTTITMIVNGFTTTALWWARGSLGDWNKANSRAGTPNCWVRMPANFPMSLSMVSKKIVDCLDCKIHEYNGEITGKLLLVFFSQGISVEYVQNIQSAD